MTEHATTRARHSLFATKGDAAPSPSVGDVSVHQPASQPEKPTPVASWVEPGPRFRIPGLEPAGPANPAPQTTLAALIRRRGGAAAKQTAIDPQQVLSIPHGAGGKPARARRVIQAARALPPWVNPNAPWTRNKAPADLPAPRPVKRRQLTVRLDPELYDRVKQQAAKSGATLQAILAGAVGVAVSQSA